MTELSKEELALVERAPTWWWNTVMVCFTLIPIGIIHALMTWETSSSAFARYFVFLFWVYISSYFVRIVVRVASLRVRRWYFNQESNSA